MAWARYDRRVYEVIRIYNMAYHDDEERDSDLMETSAEEVLGEEGEEDEETVPDIGVGEEEEKAWE